MCLLNGKKNDTHNNVIAKILHMKVHHLNAINPVLKFYLILIF